MPAYVLRQTTAYKKRTILRNSFRLRVHMKKKLLKIGVALVIILAIACIAFYNFQERFLFAPSPLSADYTYRFEVPFEEFTISTTDDATLNVVRLKADSARGAILYFHGNTGNNQSWGDVIAPLTYYGYDVYVWDYRSFGKSTGTLSEEALYADALAVFKQVSEKIPAQDIVLYGRSMGCPLAAKVAGTHATRQVLLESPFYELFDAASNVIPGLPPRFLMRYKLATHADLQKAVSPIVIFHGSEDELVPFESGVRLYRAVEDKGARIVAIKGGGHNNLDTFGPFNQARASVLSE